MIHHLQESVIESTNVHRTKQHRGLHTVACTALSRHLYDVCYTWMATQVLRCILIDLNQTGLLILNTLQLAEV